MSRSVLMRKFLLIFSLLFLTACSTSITYKSDRETITINHEQDNITTVSITAEYPLGEVKDEDTIRNDYMKVLNETYGERAVKDVKITVHDNKIKSITVLDFRTIKNLTKFGITSPYPSLIEFEKFLKNSNFRKD